MLQRCGIRTPPRMFPFSNEQVQKNAARFVTSNYRNTASTTEMVKPLGWDTLENRRLFHQLLIFYKIRHSLVNISFPLSIRENPTPSRRSGVNAFGISFLPSGMELTTRRCNSIAITASFQGRRSSCSAIYAGS